MGSVFLAATAVACVVCLSFVRAFPDHIKAGVFGSASLFVFFALVFPKMASMKDDFMVTFGFGIAFILVVGAVAEIAYRVYRS